MAIAQGQGPTRPPVDQDVLRTQRLAALRQAVWEASQTVRLHEIEEYVVAVICEIRADEA